MSWLGSVCSALEAPLAQVVSVFRDTAGFYARSENASSSDEGGATTASDEEGVTVALPPLPQEQDALLGGSSSSAVAVGGFADQVVHQVLFMGYGHEVLNALLTKPEDVPPAPPGVRYITGRQLVQELSACNYTTLTFGRLPPDTSLLYIVVGVGLLCLFLMCVCVPCSSSYCMSFLVWLVAYPMLVGWAAYGIAPTCWPMLPPNLPRDLAREVRALVPDSFDVPQFLAREECTVRGFLLADGRLDATYCFKQCAQAPFLMRSWYDKIRSFALASAYA